MPPNIEGFDSDEWEQSLSSCDSYRMEQAENLIKQKEALLTSNQNEITALLGNPSLHKLFNRNQKFFFYQLDCENTRRLAIRFDALGRVKEVQIEIVSN
ncbi:MAG: hypothetical protein ACJAZM_001735 [Cyclobacteriaceae bacterium]|jgi:hypothetical protein